MTALTAKASGTIEARTRSVIAAQVMGVVRQVMVEPGQSVRAGQTLVVIDSQQVQAGAAHAEAARLEARSALPETAAGIEAARAQLDLARTTQARLRTLFDRKSLAQQEMDEADSRVKQAESEQIVAAMEKNGLPVTYVLYPDEGHGFARPDNRIDFYARAEAFLAK